MSKPMTEARLNEIEVKQTILERAGCGNDTVKELLTEVRRLRECIAKAPHNDMCSFDKNANPFHEATDCDCGVRDWQREALGE